MDPVGSFFLLGGKENEKAGYVLDPAKYLMASPRRFERLTPSLGGKCSIQLSYGDSA